MDYISFEGRITPMPWGDNLYTVLPLPTDVTAALLQAGAKRVEGEIADHPVNLALTTAPVIDATFVYTGKALLDRIGLTPGEEVDVRFRPADPNHVELADDLQAALLATGTLSAWEDMTPGQRRGRIAQIDTAKRAETRAKRIAALTTELST